MTNNEINYNPIRHWNFRQVAQLADRLVLLAARIRNAAASAEADFFNHPRLIDSRKSHG